MLSHPFFKMISLYLVVAMFVLSVPAQGWAMIVPVQNSAVRDGDLAKVRAALESSAVRQRLVDYGLSPDEASKRVNLLTDDELHSFASNIDAAQAGGSVGGDIIFVLLVIVLVLVILELTGHRVVTRS
jgi:hypothetical protein